MVSNVVVMKSNPHTEETVMTATNTDIRPFTVSIPQADLDDLARRLESTRFAAPAPGDGWEYGTPTSYLSDMVERWKSFDWREVEARINAVPNFVTEVDGQTIHFVHVRSSAPDAQALLLAHTYPGSFTEFFPLVVGPGKTTEVALKPEELDHFANTRRETRFIIAPHDIGKDRLDECMKLYHHAVLFSEYQEAILSGKELPAGKQDANVLIMDNMGMLSRLYHYATIAYVGGGFGEDGIHNILEPAVFGKPVIFGPVYDKYFEAEELLDAAGAFTVEDALELETTLAGLLQNSIRLENAGKAAADYVKSRAGTTGRIIQYIQANRLLMS